MFFYLWQSTRTPFPHCNPYCCWLSPNIAAYPPPSQGSKLQRPISNAWCNHEGFCISHNFLRYSIGGDKPADSQHKIPPHTQACVYHFWSFSLWLAATDYLYLPLDCSSLFQDCQSSFYGYAHLCYYFMTHRFPNQSVKLLQLHSKNCASGSEIASNHWFKQLPDHSIALQCQLPTQQRQVVKMEVISAQMSK